jgi:hypothetical protein
MKIIFDEPNMEKLECDANGALKDTLEDLSPIQQMGYAIDALKSVLQSVRIQ